jgi:hypothetical protein
MPTALCRQCQTTIVDYTPVVEAHGHIYCCPNCLRVSRAHATPGVPGTPSCDHCESTILDSTTLVDRHGHYYCCYNCAAAVSAASRPLVAA